MPEEIRIFIFALVQIILNSEYLGRYFLPSLTVEI